jgi:hypothetical protein
MIVTVFYTPALRDPSVVRRTAADFTYQKIKDYFEVLYSHLESKDFYDILTIVVGIEHAGGSLSSGKRSMILKMCKNDDNYWPTTTSSSHDQRNTGTCS